jgi:hypothetical protein
MRRSAARSGCPSPISGRATGTLSAGHTFDDPNLAGEIVVTVDFKKVSCGTELNVMQEGIPDVIPLEMCYLGWQESLKQLATLVEPDIPG